MRILIHGINFSPEFTGIGKYTGEMAEWLAAQGHEVRVVTAPPYYPQWRIADDHANTWSKRGQEATSKIAAKPGLQEETHTSKFKANEIKLCSENHDLNSKSESVHSYPTLSVIYRCPLWVPKKPSGLKRILHLASFALSSLPVMVLQVFWRPDVVWVVEPALFCAPQALLVAKLSGAKAWLHIQDYEVDAAFDLNLLKGKLLRRLVTASERWLMRRFDRVSTISHKMIALALSKGVIPERTVLFPNWADLSGFRLQNARYGMQDSDVKIQRDGFHCYREELGISINAVVALYSGNMGNKQGLEMLAQAAKLHQQEARGLGVGVKLDAVLASCSLRTEAEVVYVFCGDGAGKAELVQLCTGLSNVRFMDLQPISRLSDLLEFADVHLLPQRAGAADLVMPSKLTGMLASARPVVATAYAGTELANVVNGCGLVVDPEQPYDFYHAIHLLAQDPVLRRQFGDAGRAYAEKCLDRNAVLRRFEAELKKITGKLNGRGIKGEDNENAM